MCICITIEQFKCIITKSKNVGHTYAAHTYMLCKNTTQ